MSEPCALNEDSNKLVVAKKEQQVAADKLRTQMRANKLAFAASAAAVAEVKVARIRKFQTDARRVLALLAQASALTKDESDRRQIEEATRQTRAGLNEGGNEGSRKRLKVALDVAVNVMDATEPHPEKPTLEKLSADLRRELKAWRSSSEAPKNPDAWIKRGAHTAASLSKEAVALVGTRSLEGKQEVADGVQRLFLHSGGMAASESDVQNTMHLIEKAATADMGLRIDAVRREAAEARHALSHVPASISDKQIQAEARMKESKEALEKTHELKAELTEKNSQVAMLLHRMKADYASAASVVHRMPEGSYSGPDQAAALAAFGEDQFAVAAPAGAASGTASLPPAFSAGNTGVLAQTITQSTANQPRTAAWPPSAHQLSDAVPAAWFPGSSTSVSGPSIEPFTALQLAAGQRPVVEAIAEGYDAGLIPPVPLQQLTTSQRSAAHQLSIEKRTQQKGLTRRLARHRWHEELDGLNS